MNLTSFNPQKFEFALKMQFSAQIFLNLRIQLPLPVPLKNNCSGYVMNSTLWDSTSWATEGNVHTDQMRTQYRKQFNQPKPFHKSLLLNSNGRMKKKEQIYDI